MAGYKLWAADEVLTAADLNGYLMTQAVPRFADVSTRAGAILSPATGQLTYRIDGGVYEQWNGSAWVQFSAGSAVNAGKVAGISIFNSSIPSFMKLRSHAGHSRPRNKCPFAASISIDDLKF